eukprot:TRINITY_DN5300_c1_g1_i1.p1 TRINITY_DN5300_c1_g1~~TRINITY_DN5300_c1_g1_i1.p1  ORF type:complete len:511 (+),score=87.64 TRINITY_DN5300_c1_g1_i1:54-1586(+)
MDDDENFVDANNGGETSEEELSVDNDEVVVNDGYLDEQEYFTSEEEIEEDETSEGEGEGERNGGGRVRLIPRILQMFRQSSNRRDDDNQNDSSRTNDADLTFDLGLPGQHLYLGQGSEVQGRTVFDDNEVTTIPILHYPHFVLMPGQIFPLTLFDPGSIAMMRNVLAGRKTFGMVSAHSGAPQLKGLIGTTAEIFEYGELAPEPDIGITGFKIKAKGRQRFRLQSTHTDNSGVKLGLVKMLPEISLTNPFNSSRLRSCDRKGDRKSLERNLRAFSPMPSYIYFMYDSQKLVSRVHTSLLNCGWYTDRGGSGKIPTSPEELSWWLAANLPIQDTWKYHLLGINSDIQRLRVELCILATIQVLVCRRCYNDLADQTDIFSMSAEGPQGAFVNPGGHLHETLTVYKAKNLKLVGNPSTEYSWFPGYAWTIVECSRCFNHIGWKFTAAKDGLRPDKFYGFSRKSISSALGKQDDTRPPPGGGHFPGGEPLSPAQQQQHINDDDHSQHDMADLIM